MQIVATDLALGSGSHLLFACPTALPSLLPLVKEWKTPKTSAQNLYLVSSKRVGALFYFLLNSPCLEECQGQAKTFKNKSTA